MKIAKVIKLCNDCPFSKVFIEKGGNEEFVYICKANGSILYISSSNPNHHSNKIPHNCPLDNYEGINEVYVTNKK